MSNPHQFDLDLGETEAEEEFSFPPAERRVITQPVDLSVQTLSEQWSSGVLTLPEIQREYVWDKGKASRLVESIILNIPVPVLYFSETSDARYEVIDGHQRIQSIVNYLGNAFKLSGLAVLGEYNGRTFSQLPEREQRFFRMRTLRAIIISVDSHPNMKFEVFERLNTGSISLNAQELRNSIYRGTFNNLLHELTSNTHFRKLIGTRFPRKRMVDEELILRFFALRETLDTYRTPLKRFLNKYMETVRDASSSEISSRRSTFLSTMSCALEIIGPGAFRITDVCGTPTESSINRALFDAQSISISWISNPSHVDINQARSSLGDLFREEDFLDAIQRATGDRARTIKRLRYTITALQRAGAAINPPYELDK